MAEKKYFSYDFCIIMIPVKIFLGRRCLFARLQKNQLYMEQKL